MIQLGQKGKDIITGFEGVCTGKVVYISGCNQVLLVPGIGNDGKLPESVWFDEQRVQAIDAKTITLDNSQTPGHDAPAPKR